MDVIQEIVRFALDIMEDQTFQTIGIGLLLLSAAHLEASSKRIEEKLRGCIESRKAQPGEGEVS